MKIPSTINLLRQFAFLFLLVGITSLYAHAQVTVHSYAGIGFPGFTNGDTSIAAFDNPHGIVVDPAGNVFIADGDNDVIRKIGIDGIVSTVAGSGQTGYVDGPAGFARFNEPYNICMDTAGNIYVSDFLNQRIRKISTTGIVSTVAGTGSPGYLDGPDSIAQFNYPRGIAVDDAGNLYVSDSWNHRIRKIDTNGNVSTWAGGGNTIGVQSVGDYIDGPDTTARFYTPTEISIDTAGNIYVADAFNHRIRKVSANRVVSTVAGSGPIGQGMGAFQNGPGNQARFDVPAAVHWTMDGTLYVGSGPSNKVRKIDVNNVVSTVAGSGVQGFSNGIDTLATFNFPRATAIDYNTNRLYVVDVNNNAIRYIQVGPLVGRSEPINTLVDIYPNPFSDLVTVNAMDLSGQMDVSVSNSLGQEVFVTQVLSGPRFDLDLGNLVPGMYYLTIRFEDDSHLTQKIVKRAH